MDPNPSYWTRLLIAASQLVNTIMGGYPDEMLSARAWRCRRDVCWCAVVGMIDSLFFWQEAHCRECYNWERARWDTPYRRGRRGRL